MYFYGPMGDGYNIGWGIFMLFFWILIFIIATLVISRYLKSHNEGQNQSRALDIAKERYAKGEIAKEEFEQLKKDLK